MYKHQKKYREAVRFYERVKAKCDLEVSVYVDMAQCYHELGNRVESKRLLFQASKIENATQGEVIDLLKKYSFEEWCVCLMVKGCVVCLSQMITVLGILIQEWFYLQVIMLSVSILIRIIHGYN